MVLCTISVEKNTVARVLHKSRTMKGRKPKRKAVNVNDAKDDGYSLRKRKRKERPETNILCVVKSGTF